MADIQVISPSGELGSVPESQFKDAVGKYGYRVPTPEQLKEFDLQKQFGEGLGNELKAGAAGVARGASFGLSDAALTGTGLVEPETLSQLKERNPAASVTGEIAGAVGSMLLAPGASPAGLVAKGTGAIAKAAAPAALAEGAGLGARVLNAAGNVGAKALGSSIEGAAYGLGQSVTEASLGDPDVNAERILGNVGLAALMGGAIGGVVKAGEMAIPASFSKARQVVGDTYEKLIGKAKPPEPVLKTALADIGPESAPAIAAKTGTDDFAAAASEYDPGPVSRVFAKVSSKISGTPEDEILEAIKTRATVERMSPADRTKLAKEFASSLDEHYRAVSKASRDASSIARPQEAANLLEGADAAVASAELQSVRSSLRGTIDEMRSQPELYPARFAKKLEMIETGLERVVGEEGASAAKIFRAIDDLKSNLDTKIPWGKEISGEAAEAVTLVKDLRSQIKASLEKGDVWGEAGARQQAYNGAVNDFLASKKEFQKRFMYKTQTPSGGVAYRIDPVKVNTFFNMVNDARGAQRGDALKEFFRTSRKLVDEIGQTYEKTPFESFDKDGLAGLLSGNEQTAERARNIVASQPGGFGFFTDVFHGPGGLLSAVGRSLTDPAAFVQRLSNLERASQKTADAVARAAKAVFQPAEKGAARAASSDVTTAERAARFKKRAEETAFSGSSEAMIDKLELATRDSFDIAPNITSALQQAALRGAMFLQEKTPGPKEPRLALDRPYEPSQSEIVSFDRYYDAVHSPLSVLKGLKQGKVSLEGVEALKTVYPQLYGEMKRDVMDNLATMVAKKTPVPYQKRAVLSIFLGEPIDSSELPQHIMANQQAFQKMLGDKQAEAKATASRISKLGVASRTQTSLQKSSERGN